MAKNAWTDYDATAANNTDLGGVPIQGTNNISGFDDAVRTGMAHTAKVMAGTSPLPDTIKIGNAADLTANIQFDCSAITTATTRTITMPDADVTLVTGTMVTTTSTATLTNKTLSDSTTYFADNADATKKLQFQCSGITTATTRTVTWPDLTGTVVLSTTASLSGYSWLVDEDNMASNSAVLVPSQQSVKAYVDANQGGLTFLSTQDLTSAATADFTLASGYDEYVFVIQNLVPATDTAALYAYTSANGGSTYDGTASDYNTSGIFHNSNGTAATGWGSEIASAVILTSGVGSDTNEYGISGEVTLCGAHLSKYTFLDGRFSYTNDAGNYEQSIGGGVRKSAAAVNAVRFAFSTGNIESGSITLYGRVNA